jgi:phospholipid/cholesterol/gamma-HCH transport system substrate-binding protein
MNTSKNIKLGLFLILSLVFVLLALYFIGNKRNLFSSNFTLKAQFHNVSGLQPGNNVRLMGIDVGTVKSVNILNDTTVEVIMILERNVKEFIKEDASASVGTEGLMGSKLVNISVGSPNTKVVQEGATIQTVKPVSTDDILRTVDYTSQYTAILSAELVKTISQINTGKGTLGTLLKNPQMATDLQETIAGLSKTSQQSALLIQDFRNVVSDLKNGKGPVSAVLQDTGMANNIKLTLNNLQRASNTLSKSLDNFQQLSQRINDDNGTLAMIAGDTALANNLKNTLQSARMGAEGFNQNMEALKHNFLFRGYFRKQQKN